MIKITKEEAAEVRAKLPDVSIVVANRQTSHKKYYAPEERRVITLIRNFRFRQSHPHMVKRWAVSK